MEAVAALAAAQTQGGVTRNERVELPWQQRACEPSGSASQRVQGFAACPLRCSLVSLVVPKCQNPVRTSGARPLAQPVCL